MKITNDRSSFVTVMLEPWGEDYGMSPNNEFEIIAEDADETCYFHTCHDEDYIAVYAEGTVNYYPRIFQNGKLLECGHNRQEDYSNGQSNSLFSRLYDFFFT